MGAQGTPSPQADDRDPSPKSLPAAQERGWQRLWPWVVAAVTCAGVGGVLIERLTRPAEQSPQELSVQQPLPSESTASQQAFPAANLDRFPTTAEGWTAEGKRVADRLLEAFPENAEALSLAGRAYFSFGDPAKAAECWEKCMKLHPQFLDPWSAMGTAAWQQGDYENAARCFQTAFAINPQMPSVEVIYLAHSLMHLGKADQVVSVLEKAGKLRPLPPRGLLLLGHGYLQLKQNEKAKPQFEAALALDPRLADAHYGLATALSRLGKSAEAGKHREAYARWKNQELAEGDRMHRGQRNSDVGDLLPIVADVCFRAGKIYDDSGRWEDAKRHWLTAVAADPKNPEPHKCLQALSLQHGEGKGN